MKKILMSLALALMAGFVGAAQVNEDQTYSEKVRILRASNTALSVAATGNTTLLDLDVKDLERIFVQIAPTVQAFDAFVVQIQPHTDGAYSTIACGQRKLTERGSETALKLSLRAAIPPCLAPRKA